MALLWADRALTVDQLLALVGRYADYVEARRIPVTCRPIATRDTVVRGLAALQRHGVVTRNDRGREVVYLVQPEQRIAAAYHRNSILHFFVVPAVVDLATADDAGSLHDEALRLRDLLKFEFFFEEKGEFLAEVDAEAAAPERPVTAPFLRPFLEAYWATAEALASHGDASVDADTLTTEASGLAEQFLLQQRIYCADAVSTSYVDGAVRLADHRGLLSGGPDLADRRAELAAELHTLVRRVRVAQARAAARFLELMRDTRHGG
jgi:glycerol-3-phosphate O-acyltransferase